MSRDLSELTKEHFPGEAHYRAVSASARRHFRLRGGRQGGRGVAGRDDPDRGIDRGLSAALGPWRKPLAVHDPGKVVLDLAVALALGGDCLADVDAVRAEPAVFGLVASDPTVSRLVDTLAGDVDHALAAIETARAAARAEVWTLAGEHAPDHASRRRHRR